MRRFPMMQNMVVLFVAGIASVHCASAFPSQAEIKTATEVVGDLVADDVRAASAGKAKHEAVADKILALVGQAETDAARWVLYKHAFIQYAKAGNFAKAGDVLTDTLSIFPDVPPQMVISLIDKNAARANARNAPAVARIRKLMYMRQKCSGIIASAKASQKEKAEAYCLMGDWAKGLKMFESLGGKTAEMAAAETSGKQPKHVIANYWWDYECALDTCDQFKVHAAEIYKAGLAEGSISGLYKNVAEKRIAEMEAVPQSVAPNTIGADEVSNLKKICNTKGLVHCWRFNGTLKDEIGGSEATLTGSAKLRNGYVSKSGKDNIDLGEKILPEADNITIELWVKADVVHNWDRIFVFGRDRWHRLTAFWVYDGKGSLIETISGAKYSMLSPAFGTLKMGVEYHLAVVFERDGKNYKATAYHQDVATGKTLSAKSMVIDNGWSPKAFEHENSWLGRSYWDIGGADACYNEFRIWNRALSEKELTQNAIKFYKAGETIKKD